MPSMMSIGIRAPLANDEAPELAGPLFAEATSGIRFPHITRFLGQAGCARPVVLRSTRLERSEVWPPATLHPCAYELHRSA
jgi:hypothetical protein